jgi:leucyl-tRNA synthetase
MVLAYSYKDERGKYYSPAEVEERDGAAFAKSTGEKLAAQIEKMSKSKLNVFNPDEVIEEYGADAMRLYELFMGPLDQVNPWQMSGVEGVHRFLQRTWRLVVEERDGGFNPRLADAPEESEPELRRHLHATIEKVGADTEAMRFNTAIAQMMIFVNEATSSRTLPRPIVEKFLLLLAPYAPHLSEELWERLGAQELIAHAAWPAHDPRLTVEDTVTLVVQVNGKRRDRIDMPRGARQADVEAAALGTDGARRDLAGRSPRKVIVVPDRLVNIVV